MKGKCTNTNFMTVYKTDKSAFINYRKMKAKSIWRYTIGWCFLLRRSNLQEVYFCEWNYTFNMLFHTHTFELLQQVWRHHHMGLTRRQQTSLVLSKLMTILSFQSPPISFRLDMDRQANTVITNAMGKKQRLKNKMIINP